MRLILKVRLTDEDTTCFGEVSRDIPAEAAHLSRHSFQSEYAMPMIAMAWDQLKTRVQNLEAALATNGHRAP